MKKPAEENTGTPKTKATATAVFELCDRMVATGVAPTYDLLAEHFGASNKTIAPHFRAWKEVRESSDIWDMPESLLATLADSQHTMWRAMAHLAQSKLVCETHDFKRRLVETEAKLNSNAEVIAHLEQELAEEKEQRKTEANDALQTANDMYVAQQELADAQKTLADFANLETELVRVQKQLHSKELEVATLTGLIEGMRTPKGNA